MTLTGTFQYDYYAKIQSYVPCVILNPWVNQHLCSLLLKIRYFRTPMLLSLQSLLALYDVFIGQVSDFRHPSSSMKTVFFYSFDTNLHYKQPTTAPYRLPAAKLSLPRGFITKRPSQASRNIHSLALFQDISNCPQSQEGIPHF